jgi:hypothetical protein
MKWILEKQSSSVVTPDALQGFEAGRVKPDGFVARGQRSKQPET